MKSSATSLRTYVLAAMMLVGLGPLLVFWAVLNSDLNDQVLNDARRNASERAHGLAERVAGSIGRMRSDLRALQTDPMLRNHGAGAVALEAELFRMQEAYEIFREITIYQTDGRIVATTDTTGSVPAKDKGSALKDAVEEKVPVISPPKRRLGANELYMDVYLPVENQSREVFRVIRANTSFHNVQSMLLGAQLGKSGYFALTNDSGAILVHKDNAHTLLSRLPEFEASLEGNVTIKGRDYLAVNHNLSPAETGAGQLWHLFGYIPTNEARSLVAGTQSTFVWGLALGLVVAFFASLSLANNLQKSLHPLVAASDAVANQRWDEINVASTGPSEIREVSASFNQMVDRIRSHNSEMQHRINEAVAQLESTFQSTREALLVVDLEGDVQSVNRRFTELFGLDNADVHALGGECIEELLHNRIADPDGFVSLCEPLDTTELEAEWRLAAPSDSAFSEERFLKVYRVDVLCEDDQPIAHMWVFRDFSDSRQLEQRLQQAQKMEAVGRLAGGIAHDFNNLLTSIIGNLSLLSVNIKPATKAALQLKSARTAAQRAADLVKQLLGFSRKSYLNLKHCASESLIQDVLDLLNPGNDPTAIRIAADMADSCWGVHADPTQINQVLMNLCVNAKDALQEKGSGGDIILRGENRLITTAEAVRLGGENCKGGQYVVLSVRDTGAGIPPEILERIFEPFFTTKDQGKGTGLGLATSYGIVEQHGGWMTCQSEVNVGTTFRIFLPRDRALVEVLPESKPEDEGPEVVRGGTETILLVDDDPMVRQVSDTFLSQHGYQILTGNDGEEGLEAYAKHSARISCVVLDLTMPRLSGADTFKHLRGIAPDLPVIIYSGYVINDDEFEAQNGSRPNAILCKPFALEDMANLIRDVLDENASKTQMAA